MLGSLSCTGSGWGLLTGVVMGLPSFSCWWCWYWLSLLHWWWMGPLSFIVGVHCVVVVGHHWHCRAAAGVGHAGCRAIAITVMVVVALGSSSLSHWCWAVGLLLSPCWWWHGGHGRHCHHCTGAGGTG